jgi:hypothetical protein
MRLLGRRNGSRGALRDPSDSLHQRLPRLFKAIAQYFLAKTALFGLRWCIVE